MRALRKFPRLPRAAAIDLIASPVARLVVAVAWRAVEWRPVARLMDAADTHYANACNDLEDER